MSKKEGKKSRHSAPFFIVYDGCHREAIRAQGRPEFKGDSKNPPRHKVDYMKIKEDKTGMLKLTVLHSTRAGARLADGEFRRFPLVERDGQKCLLSKTSKKFIFFKCLFNVNCVTGEN